MNKIVKAKDGEAYAQGRSMSWEERRFRGGTTSLTPSYLTLVIHNDPRTSLHLFVTSIVVFIFVLSLPIVYNITTTPLCLALPTCSSILIPHPVTLHFPTISRSASTRPAAHTIPGSPYGATTPDPHWDQPKLDSLVSLAAIPSTLAATLATLQLNIWW